MKDAETLVEWMKSRGFTHNKLLNFWEYEIPGRSPIRVSDEALSHVDSETLSDFRAAIEQQLGEAGAGS